MRDVLEVPIEDSSSINPVSVLIVSNSSLKESDKQIEGPKNQFRDNTFSDEVSICRICHGEEGDKDSVYEKEVDKLGEQSAGLAFISIDADRTQVSPASINNNSGSLSTSNSSKSSSTDQMISQMCLISPCCCAGSLQFVHQNCLQQWIRSSGADSCELCKQIFNMSISYKPFYKWKSPDMSSAEKRKLFLNLLFNLVSMLCVFWSIYVLIERATFEAKYGLLDWPFWTKMLYL
ncbi:uncharacterized protein LOC141852023 isoform X2 [Brevipalpus obovatus]|uniref:uncharacterized protein LOC141852023 isoform X2 n=1 Tax=Brevipalpus obovatus TaxID=246614 RepID=UPI003D9F43D9